MLWFGSCVRPGRRMISRGSAPTGLLFLYIATDATTWYRYLRRIMFASSASCSLCEMKWYIFLIFVDTPGIGIFVSWHGSYPVCVSCSTRIFSRFYEWCDRKIFGPPKKGFRTQRTATTIYPTRSYMNTFLCCSSNKRNINNVTTI